MPVHVIKKTLLTAMIFSVLTPNLKAARLYTGDSQTDLLGFGVDSQTGQIRQRCITGDTNLWPNKSLDLKVHLGAQTDEFLEVYEGSTSIGVDLWLIGGKGKQEFLIRNTETDRRVSLIWEVHYEYGTQAFHRSRLSLLGESTAKRNPTQRRQVCGNQFIEGVRLGAKMFLAVSLQFPSEESYKKFRTEITISALFGLIKHTEVFEKTFHDYASEALLKVRSLQLGGDSQQLERLTANQPGYCDKATVAECLEHFKKIYQYMYRDEGFRQSLANTAPKDLYPLYFLTADYGDTAHDQLAVNDEDSANSLPTGVNHLFTAIQTLYQQLDDIDQKLFKEDLSATERRRLQHKQERLKAEIDAKLNQLDACRHGSIANCQSS